MIFHHHKKTHNQIFLCILYIFSGTYSATLQKLLVDVQRSQFPNLSQVAARCVVEDLSGGAVATDPQSPQSYEGDRTYCAREDLSSVVEHLCPRRTVISTSRTFIFAHAPSRVQKRLSPRARPPMDRKDYTRTCCCSRCTPPLTNLASTASCTARKEFNSPLQSTLPPRHRKRSDQIRQPA